MKIFFGQINLNNIYKKFKTNFNMKNRKIIQIFFISLMFIIVVFLLNSNLLGSFIGKNEILFGDYNILITWLECDFLGFDVYNLESIKNCPSFNTIMLYGHIWLSIPFNETLKIFYLNYVPYLTILLFLFSLIIIVNPKSFIEYFILILAILNPSTFLLIERLGFDIFIFLFVIFINYNRVYFINWSIIFCLSFIKIYPAVLGINIFLENINRSIKKNFLLIASIIFISIIHFYFYYDEYQISLIEGSSHAARKAGYHYLFSLNSLPKIFKYIFELNYIFLLIIFYSIFIFSTKWFYNKLETSYSQITDNSFTKNGKLFVLGGFLLVFCFITYSNYIYREVFILLLLPYIIFLKNKNIHNLIKFLFFLTIIRFLFLFFYGYLNVNDDIQHIEGVRQFSKKFLISITIKSILDFLMMSLVSSILFLKVRKFKEIKYL